MKTNLTKHKNLLKINSSARFENSVTRQTTERLTKQIQQVNPDTRVITRELATGLPFIDEKWVAANFTPPEERTQTDIDTLSFSDELVAELIEAETIVIASPLYNFSIPAVLKAWVDLISRARLTFRYTSEGSEGLLKGKKAYIVIASGGVPVGSQLDFASGYLKQVLTFIGITDITMIDATITDSIEKIEKEIITA